MSLATLQYENRFTEQFPADPETGPARRQVANALYSRVAPTAAPAPKLIAHAREVLDLLGLPEASAEDPEFAQILCGNLVPEGMDCHATAYGGHQFGNWAGQLGDGRAINLGEAVGTGGQRWMLQLKGAGETPYSRTADGYAVLRSSVREFLCSEAMHHLGVPTTRALSLCTTGNDVLRDMFYDGRAAYEPGAVVCRVAESFIRFGHFELLASRGEEGLLRQLADYVITEHFTNITADGSVDAYLQWFEDVCQRTAEMIAHWMRVGFVHGVMNTDNMSILGQTIDYGPYGWLDDFDPTWTPNTSDTGSRYCYQNQPAIGQWNLLRLANAIFPLIKDASPLEDILKRYTEMYNKAHHRMQCGKLGFEEKTDEAFELVDELLPILADGKLDLTLFYRQLTTLDLDDPDVDHLEPSAYKPIVQHERWQSWLNKYAGMAKQVANRVQIMDQCNPRYILRNYLVQVAIDQAHEGDYAEISRLLEVARKPYEEQQGAERFTEKRPDWAIAKAGCSQLSCSS